MAAANFAPTTLSATMSGNKRPTAPAPVGAGAPDPLGAWRSNLVGGGAPVTPLCVVLTDPLAPAVSQVYFDPADPASAAALARFVGEPDVDVLRPKVRRPPRWAPDSATYATLARGPGVAAALAVIARARRVAAAEVTLVRPLDIIFPGLGEMSRATSGVLDSLSPERRAWIREHRHPFKYVQRGALRVLVRKWPDAPHARADNREETDALIRAYLLEVCLADAPEALRAPPGAMAARIAAQWAAAEPAIAKARARRAARAREEGEEGEDD